MRTPKSDEDAERSGLQWQHQITVQARQSVGRYWSARGTGLSVGSRGFDWTLSLSYYEVPPRLRNNGVKWLKWNTLVFSPMVYKSVVIRILVGNSMFVIQLKPLMPPHVNDVSYEIPVSRECSLTGTRMNSIYESRWYHHIGMILPRSDHILIKDKRTSWASQ